MGARMTLRAIVYACGAIAAFVSPMIAKGQENRATDVVQVAISAPATAVVGVPADVVCVASDPHGISRLALSVNAPTGVRTALGATFGAAELHVKWVPVGPGTHALRCRATGQSSEGAIETASRAVLVVAGAPVKETPAAPAIPALADPAAPVFPAKAPTVGSVAYAGDVGAGMRGPRRIAATPDGNLYAVDREGRLFRLTKRGDVVGVLLEGAVSVAAGSSVVFAALKGGAVVGVDPLSGRVESRFDLAVSSVPVGLAYDEPRGQLWLAFSSGVVEVRRPDGELVRRISATTAGPLVRVVDVAVSPSGLVWVAQDRAEPAGYLHAFSAETGEFVRSIASGVAPEARIIGGIAAAWGRLYVTDLFSGNVRVMNEDGATIEVLGKKGFGAGELALPAGAAFLVNGDLVVASMDANRIERFGAGAALPVCEGDSDCDGLPDAWELANGMDPNDPRGALEDVDGDGLNAAAEFAYGTNPRKADTDGDGYSDSAEILAGYNPTDPNDHRPLMVVDVPSVVDPGVVQLASKIDDRGKLGGCSAAWSQVSGPTVALQGDPVSPSFIARRGVYQFRGVATCAGAAGLPSDLTVAIRNVPARVEVPRVVAADAGSKVALSASFSSDANGDALTFEWDQILGPAVAESRRGAAFSTRLGSPGLYGFQATVDDGWGQPSSSEVAVVALGREGALTAVIPATAVARAGEEVVLDASASYRTESATFAWEQVGGPAVELAGEGDAVAFTPPTPGRYTFRVSIADGALRSPAAEVAVYVAASGGVLPLASITAPRIVAVNKAISLSAAGSGGGGPLKYAWRQVRGPAAGLTNADRESATVVAFEPGAYEFELTVDDGVAVGLPKRVGFEARAGGRAIPIAYASAPAAAEVGKNVTLSGVSSVHAAEWRWTQVEGPWVEVGDGPLTSFRPYAPGVYGFELEVNDGRVRSAPARVNVVVIGK
jgi:hypothetical protein